MNKVVALHDDPPHPVPLVRLEHVAVRFGERPVFADLSFRLFRGEHLALLGANGAGKSTLLRLLQGELRPAQNAETAGKQRAPGRIYWNFEGEEEPFALSAINHARLVSPIQQQRYMRHGRHIRGEAIVLSGLDNSALPSADSSERQRRLAAQFASSAGAEQLLDMPASTMSQGQLRLMLILRALISRPILLLLDEPFDGLDIPSRGWITRCLHLAAEQGSTVILSAHREEDIPSFISGALILQGGNAVRARFPSPARRLPASPPPRAAAWSAASGDVSPAGDDPAQKSPLLELEHVDVFVDRRQVLHGINWRIFPGERWLLSGGNGAGKSTLLRLIQGGEFAACGGTIRWRGGPRPPLEELRSRVGYVSDNLQYSYDYDLSAEEVVISGLRGSIGLYREPDARERALARDWMDIMGVSAVRAQNFFALSSGMSRRVLLARALAASPPLLLLDEPCSGLDEQSRMLFLQGLALLGAKGVTIIHVTHHEQDRNPLLTHELRLNEGRIDFCGKRAMPAA
ncbi:MAG: ATP-binding cassette domain-containing protein [Desulfovibrio sp.]|jgi:molybdate transport system ATP-binding protein|nr:ATP-binding cassette domain-containing protein [Desulfovibrio sp.]